MKILFLFIMTFVFSCSNRQYETRWEHSDSAVVHCIYEGKHSKVQFRAENKIITGVCSKYCKFDLELGQIVSLTWYNEYWKEPEDTHWKLYGRVLDHETTYSFKSKTRDDYRKGNCD